MNEIKFFSSRAYDQAMNFGSPTAAIAKSRNACYNAVMGNVEAVRNHLQKLGLFSQTSIDMQAGTLGVSLREASLRAYLDSFAGFIAIERPLSQMKELIVYNDKVTKGTGRVISPFLGKNTPRPMAESKQTNKIPLSANNEVELGCGVVPGSLSITAIDATTNEPYQLMDDRKGNILAAGGVLTKGTINYLTGKLELEFTSLTDGTANITFNRDKYLEDTPERMKVQQHYFEIDAKVQKFEYELDIIASAINQKSIGYDLATDLRDSIRDEHQMTLNDTLVRTLRQNYAGTTLTIDLSSFTVASGRFSSMMKVLNAGLVNIDAAIAKNCYKITAATAYVVGKGIGALLSSWDDSNFWVPNNSGFVNGLIGFYKGRAVLQHLDCGDFEGYAIHKTADGAVAPVALGIFLPATDLPMVGNFNNTNELAGGIYAVEGVNTITNDLVQRFEIAMPQDWMIQA